MEIIGEFCCDEKSLRSNARRRKRPFIEKSVKHRDASDYFADGWKKVRESKNTTRIKKNKFSKEAFEDRVWKTFYDLGFKYLNEEGECSIKLNGKSRDIHVIAKDEDNIFIIRCLYASDDRDLEVKKEVKEFYGGWSDIQKAIRRKWGHDAGRINIVFVVSSQEKRESDIEYVKKYADKNLFLWSIKEVDYIESLSQQIGSAAKYQLYSIIFKDKKQNVLKVSCPAIKGKIGGRKFYTFLMSAKQLLKYAYVHHRDLSGIIEASQVYQRMLRKNKLKEIGKFIDLEGGYFPNSLIVNFSKKLGWEKVGKSDENVSMGNLQLPGYFGCAWIIDGQHRLYGAASAESDILVPVLAFDSIDVLEQANLFVEINEKQTSVPKHLLWDLYSDIYRDSSDEKQKFLFQLAEVAKNMEIIPPFKGCIDIPSIPIKREAKLSLTTVCSTIQKFAPWSHLIHHKDDSRTPENIARIVSLYFETIKHLCPEEWAKGNEGVVVTNNGFGVFMMVFQDIINYLASKHGAIVFQEHKRNDMKKLFNELLSPAVGFFKSNMGLQKDIKNMSSRGGQGENAEKLGAEINKLFPDFTPPRLKDKSCIPENKGKPLLAQLEEKAKLAENILRKFVLEKLKNHYGSKKWWKQGLPEGVKKTADNAWAAEVRRKPYRVREGNENENKFNYLSLGCCVQVVAYGSNWSEIFEDIFIDRANFERRINDIAAFRNPAAHDRGPDNLDVVDGNGGLLWLAECLGEQELKPVG